jgi:hypothetical protein
MTRANFVRSQRSKVTTPMEPVEIEPVCWRSRVSELAPRFKDSLALRGQAMPSPDTHQGSECPSSDNLEQFSG